MYSYPHLPIADKDKLKDAENPLPTVKKHAPLSKSLLKGSSMRKKRILNKQSSSD